MGLDFSYILYFEKERFRDALNALLAITSKHHTPTNIIFPDGEITVPWETWVRETGEYRFDEPEMHFHFSIDFEEDDAIFDYISRINRGDPYRSPPDENGTSIVSIGYIYLSIYNENSEHYFGHSLQNMVAFDFGTTGTKMSLLFSDSTSIRSRFVTLLKSVPGVCGVFNREMEAEVFWYRGQPLSEYVPDPYLPPAEIKTELGLKD